MPEDSLPNYSKIEAFFHVTNLTFQFSRVSFGFLRKHKHKSKFHGTNLMITGSWKVISYLHVRHV